MKTLKYLAAAAALSLGLAATSTAATYRPNPGPVAAVKYLACAVVKPSPAGGKIEIATLRITNTSGVTLKVGTRIYVNYTLKNGLAVKDSFLLSEPLIPGASTEKYGGGLTCTAQVNLLAKQEKLPPPPVIR